jgi:hypothetical protein
MPPPEAGGKVFLASEGPPQQPARGHGPDIDEQDFAQGQRRAVGLEQIELQIPWARYRSNSR